MTAKICPYFPRPNSAQRVVCPVETSLVNEKYIQRVCKKAPHRCTGYKDFKKQERGLRAR